jgi:nicotinate-nucleotide adenylyltransferase
MRRGILGGTFDPPHMAHLVAGETAHQQLSLDIVTFMPAGAPWQKAERAVTEPHHRWQMTMRAVDGIEYFEADDREIRRDGWTFTIDTLLEFTDDDDLVLILGADAAAGLPTWHRAEEVAQRATIAVMPRPGVDRAAVDIPWGRVVWLEAPELAMSGTLIRAHRGQGRSVRFLVPEPVFAYIEEHGLYQEP